MKPTFNGETRSAEEERTHCSRVTSVSVGQGGWTRRRVIGQLVLLQMLVFTPEGCSKSQSFETSTSGAGPPHDSITTAMATGGGSPHTSHPTSDSHMLSCSTNQLGLAGCLNGGTCFIVEPHNSSSTVAHCSCTSEWAGDRCQYKYVDPTDWANYEARKLLKQICIAIGVGTVVLVAVILIFFALYRRRANSSTASANSLPSTNNDQTTRNALITHDKQKTCLNEKSMV